jgi:hypothetical protein
MKFQIVFIIAFTLIALTSCNQSNQGSEQTLQLPALPQKVEQSTPVNQDPLQPPKTETAEQPLAEQNNTAVKLNPAHGLPNHRCDIPVGAPLDSPPANNTQIPANSQIQASQNSITAPNISNNPTAPTIENARKLNPSMTRVTSSNTGPKPRLNPPHGQPWHLCEIAVGSPLP